MQGPLELGLQAVVKILYGFLEVNPSTLSEQLMLLTAESRPCPVPRYFFLYVCKTPLYIKEY